MDEIIILGYGIRASKDGKQHYTLSFSCATYRDALSAITTGAEASTCELKNPELYNIVCRHKVGDKVKAGVYRENFKLAVNCIIDEKG